MGKFFEKYGFYIFFVLGLVCAAAIVWPLFSFVPEDDKPLDVTFIDVGQADSALIICPDGATALVDAGADMCAGTPEEGAVKNAEIILSLLRQKGVSKLDTVFISHTDSDHIGALGLLMEKIPVGKVVAAERDKKTIAQYFPASCQDVPYVFAGAGDFFSLGGNVSMDCLFPDKEKIDLSAPANSRSLVCRLSFEVFSILFAGDVGADALSLLIRRPWKKRLTVLKFPHHGAFCPELEEFVAKLRPQLSVISCGRANRYGHPDEKTLEMLGREQLLWARTDRNGNVSLRSNGWGFCVEPQRQSLRVSGVLGQAGQALDS